MPNVHFCYQQLVVHQSTHAEADGPDEERLWNSLDQDGRPTREYDGPITLRSQ
jgi:hypothetical protein